MDIKFRSLKDAKIAELQARVDRLEIRAKAIDAAAAILDKYLPHWRSFGENEEAALCAALDSSLRMVGVVSSLESWADEGYSPALVNDDNGHWAVSFCSSAPVFASEERGVAVVSVFVQSDDWKDTVEKAVDDVEERGRA